MSNAYDIHDGFDFGDEINVRDLREDLTVGPAWREEAVLRTLYWDYGLTQSEIANGFGITQQTVSRWFKRHDIDTREGERGKTVLRYRRDDEATERVQYVATDGDRGQDTVYQSQLVALLEFDADDVFADDAHVHHELALPVALDVPANLDVVGDREHQHIHGGEYDPDAEAVLNAMRDWPCDTDGSVTRDDADDDSGMGVTAD